MKVICVDDEQLAVSNFQYFAERMEDIETLHCFYNGPDALAYARENMVDIAFLDIEMPVMGGLELAKRLQALQPDIEFAFVTGYSNFALDSYQIGGIGYLLKPYEEKDIRSIFSKMRKMIKHAPKSRVFMRTFGAFDLFIDGNLVSIKNAKAKELLALLVDRQGGSMTPAMICSYLWEDKVYDAVTKSYIWRTVKELNSVLEEYEAADILHSSSYDKAIVPDKILCDYYEIMKGNMLYADQYNGYYMNQYSWAEETVPIIENKLTQLKQAGLKNKFYAVI